MNRTLPDERPALPASRPQPAPAGPVVKDVPGGRFHYLHHLQRLYASRLGPWTRAAHFVLVGSTGLVIDLLVFSVLLLCCRLSVARMLAIWVAMTWNFWLNRQLTFFDTQRRGVLKQYVLFCASCLLGALLNWSVSVGLCTTLAFFDRWKQLAAICGVVAGTGSNYLLSCRVVFPEDKNGSAGPGVHKEPE